ncbi:ABC transporter, ATP-binding protein [Catonella morbi ATCC 51271]|uniref:ABC transporter, ATP-binding protein n=1 Tax=Catonella morbi ATCC 51271 TaxID=592026 RepID=V2XYX6_9FIRM|nr:ABC transporter ATP-binding protein [Catonella morbi]ESL01933.1 ABC transporter, ATP-binding protein [Catonella morbi ATCC 51271]
MIELIKRLYIVAGKQSGRITKMLIFNTLKSFFESFMLGGVLFILMKICEGIFDKNPVVMKDVYTVAVIELVGVVGKITCGYFADKNKNTASYSFGAENRLIVGDRLKKVNMGYFNDNSLGDVAGRMSTAISELETVGVFIITALIAGTIQTVMMGIFIFPFDMITGFIILATIAIGVFINSLVQNKMDRLTTVLLKIRINLSAKTLEYVKGISVLKAFGKNKEIAKELEDSISATRKGFLDIEKIMAPIQLLYLAVFKLGIVAIIGTSLLRFWRGNLNPTKAIMLIVASFVVFSGIEMVGGMQNLKGIAVQDLDSVMKLRSLKMIDEGEKTEINEPSVELKDVSFSYGEGELFHKLNLSIPSGKTTAIVGFSGSGKTTLCNLVSRFWDVTGGEVIVGGKNVKDFNYDAFLANFSFVFQDVYLFDDTVRNNIKFGNQDATDEEMMEVAKKARCHDFIMSLSDGYDTVLQEGGSNLSGGERQRISIARAMLKPSKIVILDEATSSIDPENEKQLLQALEYLLKDKTTIIIAHKLNTIKNADQIVVLDKGGIESCGTHAELMQKSPVYQKFVAYRESATKWEARS